LNDYRKHNLFRGAEFNGTLKEYEKSFHFKDRLFDRDTLYTHYYTINFLYVIKNYAVSNKIIGQRFKNSCRIQFRKDLQKFFFRDSGYRFFERKFVSIEAIEAYVTANFKRANGKIYRFVDEPRKLIVALHENDKSHGLNLKEFNSFSI